MFGIVCSYWESNHPTSVTRILPLQRKVLFFLSIRSKCFCPYGLLFHTCDIYIPPSLNSRNLSSQHVPSNYLLPHFQETHFHPCAHPLLKSLLLAILFSSNPTTCSIPARRNLSIAVTLHLALPFPHIGRAFPLTLYLQLRRPQPIFRFLSPLVVRARVDVTFHCLIVPRVDPPFLGRRRSWHTYIYFYSPLCCAQTLFSHARAA